MAECNLPANPPCTIFVKEAWCILDCADHILFCPTRWWLSRTYLLSREKKILPTYLFIYFIYFVLNDTNFPEKYYAPALRSSDNWDDFCFDLSKLKNSRLCSFLKTSLFHGPTGAEFRRFSFWVLRGYWWLQYFWYHRFAREKRFRLWKDYVPNTPVVPIQNKEFSGKVSMATLKFNFLCFLFIIICYRAHKQRKYTNWTKCMYTIKP